MVQNITSQKLLMNLQSCLIISEAAEFLLQGGYGISLKGKFGYMNSEKNTTPKLLQFLFTSKKGMLSAASECKEIFFWRNKKKMQL